MTSIGTTFSDTATRVLLCGSGELGKEVVIELQRLGAEVIACDRYENAPAMQVADRSYAFSMLDGEALHIIFTLMTTGDQIGVVIQCLLKMTKL